MHNDSISSLAACARAAIADPARITIVGNDANPRFELFHAASSLCSQKVRTVLLEKRLPYRSNDMLILSAMGPDGVIPAEHYHPPYVRLRLIAGQEIGREFVTGYSGRPSVDTDGFDPCAVPLLVDHEASRVIADSRRICCYLDAVSRAPIQLLPDDDQERAAVMRQVEIVDQMPNGALLYGSHPDADRRPDALKAIMETVYDHKIAAIEAMLADNAEDNELVAAYRAKLAKERGGRAVRRDAAFQRAARHHVERVLKELDRTLVTAPAQYVAGHAFSLGDVLWGVNLVRLAYLGLAPMWDDLPNVARYAEMLAKRPSLCREAIRATIDSLPPSQQMDALGSCVETSPA
ncbi:glutathione S-transferase [Cupriavidus alkaliphilus]|uniref:glutathione S-transferase family protein n=1 Tax=Cupriavidus alkaliphilus TaxID=942866 RepID=UPI0008161F66|nr:glutathione S-transferase [Cupriavidus alkaliphilus]PVY69295.1 glutathione S-transferase [Cupriavidus alkaliphilus]SCB34899.1 Glutathione S-transferase [Cupriavidus alkaliphilus]